MNIPEGWPTEEMLDAARSISGDYGTGLRERIVAALAAAPIPPAPNEDSRFGAVATIMQDVCEAEPANPDLPDTVCINVDDLKSILDDHIKTPPAPDEFQQRVQPWMMECFGQKIAADKAERNHRFLEEALELVQACACSQDEAHQLVDYVYGRPIGLIHQEVGGVMVTLAALCLAHGIDMHAAGEVELTRIWTKVEQIRAKQAAKPRHSPLPVAQPAPEVEPVAEIVAWECGIAINGIGGKITRFPVGTKLYTHPANDGLRKAAEELIAGLDNGSHRLTEIENLRAELEKRKS